MLPDIYGFVEFGENTS